jgi:hypothetical protein
VIDGGYFVADLAVVHVDIVVASSLYGEHLSRRQF